MRDPKNGVGIG